MPKQNGSYPIGIEPVLQLILRQYRPSMEQVHDTSAEVNEEYNGNNRMKRQPTILMFLNQRPLFHFEKTRDYQVTQ